MPGFLRVGGLPIPVTRAWPTRDSNPDPADFKSAVSAVGLAGLAAEDQGVEPCRASLRMPVFETGAVTVRPSSRAHEQVH